LEVTFGDWWIGIDHLMPGQGSTHPRFVTVRGWLLIAAGIVLLASIWLLAASLVEAIFSGAVAVAMIGFAAMMLAERRVKPPYADAAMWLVGFSTLILIA
jgi:hypothetical protein